MPSIFEKGPDGAVTLDLWTENINKIPYLGVMVHYVDLKGKVCKRLIANKPLEVNTSKTGEYLRAKILEILESYGIVAAKPTVVFISDRGKNIIKALEPYTRHSCGPHFINNTVNEILGNGRPLQIVNVCKDIVAKIHFLGKNSLFEPIGIEPRVVSFCSTRWNTATAMMESISTHWETILNFCREYGCKPILRDATKQEIDDLIQFLITFRKAPVELHVEHDEYKIL